MTTLRHRPTGWDHPYEQASDERAPRQPEVDQPIRLQAVTESEGVFKRVWWRWKWNDENWVETHAEKDLDFTGDGEQWTAQIPGAAERCHLTYQLWGETQDDERAFGGEYGVDILEWVQPDRILDITAMDGVLRIGFGFDQADFAVEFSYQMDKDGHLLIGHHKLGEGAPVEKGQGAWQGSGTERWQNGPFQIQASVKDLCIAIITDNEILLEEESPFSILLSEDGSAYALRRYVRSEDNPVYIGLGERFNGLNQAGKRLDTRVFEQYRWQGKKTYIPIPFFLSSSGYGWFQNMNRRAVFDFPISASQPLTITQETGQNLAGESVLFSHPEYEEIVKQFTNFIAKPALPPIWTFGLWMSGNEWNNQAEVNRQVALMKKHQIPATVFVIEAWSDEATYYIWNDAQYEVKNPAERFTLDDFSFPSDGLWPDPKEMAEHLHGQGLKLILWQIPVLKHLFPRDFERHGTNEQHDLDEAYMIEQGYCVKTADAAPYRVPPIWFAQSLVWDVTHPEGVDWWLSKRQYLLDEIGVDGFKTDGGEHLWGRDLKFADGRTNAELWNEYPKLYQDHFYNFIQRMRDGNGVCFSRAGYIGSQTSPIHWAGDQDSTWDSFRAVLMAGQNLGICGVPFWGWDIGGFSGPIPSAELYLRSTAAAAFAPVMQYHSAPNDNPSVSIDRTPWNIQEQSGDERVIPIFRKFANLRMNLLPYLYSEAVHSSRTGQPIFGCPYVRFMDQQCLEYPYQFLCGQHLLVAPVTEPGVTAWHIYLPEGEWVDFWTGDLYHGGQVIKMDVGLDQIPVFVREGAILPFHLNTASKFFEDMGNNLDNYETLAFVSFGSPTSDWRYAWTDYITGGVFELRHDMDLGTVKSALMGKVNEVVQISI